LLSSDLQRLVSRASAALEGGSAAARGSVDDGSWIRRLSAEAGAAGPPPSARALARLLGQVYGDDGASLGRHLRRLATLCGKFLELYGDGPVEVLRAPARINVLGEHVDYVSYLPTCSLPFGSREHDMLMLYRAREDARVRGASTHADYPPFEFTLDEGPPADSGREGAWDSYLFAAPPPAPHWGNYVRGSCFFARSKFGSAAARGFDFVVDSSIPPKGGASSSSALVVLAGAAVRGANAVAFGPRELALDSAKAEWYVGTRGGSMDHLTICLAEAGRAVHISYAGQTARPLPLPGGSLRWVTFFSHPADKGREIMLAYNERAAVSRLLIPAIIEGWSLTAPPRHAEWEPAAEALASGDEGAADAVRSLLALLPETVTLEEVERDHPGAYRRCAEAFPALVSEGRARPLRVRAYALHHLGEVVRVAAAERLLAAPPAAGESTQADSERTVRRLGSLLNESHESLRDLYGVSTREVEALVGVVRAEPSVYGARLMGGGFGGNVLALIDVEHLPALAERVQREFYGPRGRDCAGEGSVMVSTPGGGLSGLSVEAVLRRAVEEFNSLGPEAARDRRGVCALLDDVGARWREAWPVIVAAGKGSRARESGLDVPKPVARVGGVPAVLRVLCAAREACGASRPPVVIVSAETEAAVREALAGEEVIFVTQPEPRGTGDAVLHARAAMEGYRGRAVVVWGTQPVVGARTIKRALKLAALFGEYAMVLPTALKDDPYAPIERDAHGRVAAASETHLEGAARPDFGETNIGLFVLDAPAMFDALAELRRRHRREAEGPYDRPGGELGFPNEMINYMAARPPGVMACPFADPREGQGIKTLEDVARCERYLSELGGEEG
jgi:galactokinase/CTP:molybdopterin cytidylyltransferase MocA